MVPIRKKIPQNTSIRQGLVGGFTLLETIVSLALFSIILLVLFYLFDGYHATFNSQQALINAAGSSRQTFNEIQSNALEATQVLATTTIAGTAYASGASTLALQLPSRDASGDIINGAYDYTVFYLNGGKLYRRIQTNASSTKASGLKLLSDAVLSLTFSYDNIDFTHVNKITVDLITDASSGRTAKQFSSQEQVHMRNN